MRDGLERQRMPCGYFELPQGVIIDHLHCGSGPLAVPLNPLTVYLYVASLAFGILGAPTE